MHNAIKSLNFPERIQTMLRGSSQGIKDTLVSMIPQLIGVVTGFIASVLIARGLGSSGLGRYALVMSIVGIAGSLSDLGISATAVRFASRAFAHNDPSGQTAVLRWAFRLRIGLVAAISIFFLVAAGWIADSIWHDTSLKPFIRLGLLISIFIALSSVPTVYFQSIRDFGTNAIILSIQKVIFFAGILLLAWWSLWSLSSVLLATLVASAIGAVTFLILIPREAIWQPGEFPTDEKFTFRRLWKCPGVSCSGSEASPDTESPTEFAFFQLLSSVFVMLTLQADVWLIGYFLDKSQVGTYSAAMRFTLPLTILLGALNTALWPRASACATMEQTATLLKKTFRLTALLAVVCVFYSIGVPLLAPILFGQEYQSSVLLGQLLSARYCFAILICPIGIIGYNFGIVKIIWKINAIQLFIVVAINILLLPHIGTIASAFAIIGNDIFGCFIAGLIILQKIRSGHAIKNNA